MVFATLDNVSTKKCLLLWWSYISFLPCFELQINQVVIPSLFSFFFLIKFVDIGDLGGYITII